MSAPVATNLAAWLRQIAARLDAAQQAGDADAFRQAVEEFAAKGSEVWVQRRKMELAARAGAGVAELAGGFLDRLLSELPGSTVRRKRR